MNLSFRTVALILSLSLLAAGPAWAESSPEARKYLTALTELAEGSSFQADYSLEATTSAMGQPVRVDVSGRVTQSDRAHMRTTMDMTMTMKAAEGAENASDMTMEIRSLVVADGSILWTEMDNPMMGGKQVMKIGIEQLENAGSGSAFRRQLAALDPVSQMRQLATLFDFEVASRDGGTVTLQADVTREGLGRMGIAPDLAAAVSSFTIDIDEETGFVEEVRISGDEPVLVMRITGFRTLDPDRIEPGLFSYEPPEGVRVVDLAAAGGG